MSPTIPLNANYCQPIKKPLNDCFLLILFLILFYYLCVSVLPEYISVHHMGAVSMEVRRRLRTRIRQL